MKIRCWILITNYLGFLGVGVGGFPNNSNVTLSDNNGNGGDAGIRGSHCVDHHGQIILPGIQYVPGPDTCISCSCGGDGGPQLCRAILCQPPQGCKESRVGSACCDFVCLDEGYGKGRGGRDNGGFSSPVDIGIVIPKIILTALLSMLSLSVLFFLVNRLRQRELRGRMEAARSRQMCDECDDTRSLDLPLYEYERSSSARHHHHHHLHRHHHSHLFPPQYLALWKPPPSYFPSRCEAPPPYEEAIASSTTVILPANSGSGTTLITLPQPYSQELNQQPNTSDGLTTELSDNKTGSDPVPGSSSGAAPDANELTNDTPLTTTPQTAAERFQHLHNDGFRQSLTLPRRPSELTYLEGELTRDQKRRSLQFHVTWDSQSSSSSISLTPLTPPIGQSSLGSGTSSSSNSNTSIKVQMVAKQPLN